MVMSASGPLVCSEATRGCAPRNHSRDGGASKEQRQRGCRGRESDGPQGRDPDERMEIHLTDEKWEDQAIRREPPPCRALEAWSDECARREQRGDTHEAV